MKSVLYLIMFCTIISCKSQKISIYKSENVNAHSFLQLIEQENSKYSVKKILGLQEGECKMIILKKDNTNIVICKEYKYSDNKRVDSIYSKSVTYVSDYDGFKSELTELSYYNSAGQITKSEKYLNKLLDSYNTKIYLPLENIIYQNGSISEIKKNQSFTPLHKILMSVFSIYQRENLAQQGGEIVSIGNYEDSRSEILKKLNQINDKIELTKDFEEEDWVIIFSKKQKNYIIGINDKSGKGSIQLEPKRDVEEDISHQ